MTLFFLGTALVAHRPPKAASARVERRETTRPPSPADPMMGPGITLGLTVGLGNLVLFVLGIGLVRYRRWAARGAQIWSIAVMGLMIGSMVWTFAASFQMASAAPAHGAYSLIPLSIMLLPYPVLLLIFFSRARVIASMQRR